ncbi:MAG: hypothetical protein R3Y50_02170 [Rikenellaceae bacterium]
MKITVIFPTITESKYFKREDVELTFCGVGLIASAFGTYKAILETQPDIIIMGGIAGVYKGVDLEIGDAVIVEREFVADLGLFNSKGFCHIADDSLDMSFKVMEYIDCPHISMQNMFKTAVSNSMNCGLAPFVKTEGVAVENMEGASFFYVAKELGVKFLELRTISNVVDVSHEDWDYETSIKNLANSLNNLIDNLLTIHNS